MVAMSLIAGTLVGATGSVEQRSRPEPGRVQRQDGGSLPTLLPWSGLIAGVLTAERRPC